MLPQDEDDKMQLLQLPVSYSVPTEFRALSYPEPDENTNLREDVVISMDTDTGADGDERGDQNKNTMIKAGSFGGSFTRGIIITETSERPADSTPFKIIPQNENTSVEETGKVGGQLKSISKTTTKKQNPAPRIETRYFCHSCWCYVEQSQRRHDQMVHKPPRQATYKKIRTYSASAPTPPLFDCNICEKKFASKGGLSSHKRVHATAEDKIDCFCYECNISVKKENYIDHLIMDDEARKFDRTNRVISNSGIDTLTNGANFSPSKDNNGEMEEWKRRRFIYLNPNDPARNGPDAMLLCDKCPFTVFSTSRKFQEHNMAKHRKSGE